MPSWPSTCSRHASGRRRHQTHRSRPPATAALPDRSRRGLQGLRKQHAWRWGLASATGVVPTPHAPAAPARRYRHPWLDGSKAAPQPPSARRKHRAQLQAASSRLGALSADTALSVRTCSLPNRRRHPASGQRLWAVAACSRQAAPGFAPASPSLTADQRHEKRLMSMSARPSLTACSAPGTRPASRADPARQPSRPRQIAALDPARAGLRRRALARSFSDAVLGDRRQRQSRKVHRNENR